MSIDVSADQAIEAPAARPGGTVSCPRRHWYVVAESHEVTDQPLARRVCGDDLVLYRTSAGQVVALPDRCPHRGYPLSPGCVVGDEIQCGYHGLRFGPDGSCRWAPGQERIPSAANLAARPIVERAPWVFVWMGDPDAPDHERLTPIPWFGNAEWAVAHGMEPLDAPYGLLIDNLLDLSHETFLHGGSIGTPEVAETPITTEVAGDVVFVSRRMENVECPPFYQQSTGLQTPIDRWQDIEYHAPGVYLLHVRVAPAGSDPDHEDPRAARVEVLYAITPCDDDTTLDFWAVARNFALDDGRVQRFIAESNRSVVLEDVAALSLIATRNRRNGPGGEVSFKIDRGGLAARRVLASQIERENLEP